MNKSDDIGYIPEWHDVVEAHERIAPHIRRTEIFTNAELDARIGASLFFKCENLQPPGAFKVRGASNAVFGLSDAQAVKGVATHSSGNHALCLSYAAGHRGIPCNVVMPHTAPQAKKDAVIGYGGKITECEPSTSSREETFARVQAETGGDLIHPYNDPRVIAGPATCSMEFREQVETGYSDCADRRWRDDFGTCRPSGRLCRMSKSPLPTRSRQMRPCAR